MLAADELDNQAPQVYSVAAFAVDVAQPVTFETQEMVHAVARAVGPFLDGHFVVKAIAVEYFTVAEEVAAAGFAAFAEDFAGAVVGADQGAAAAQGRGLDIAGQ